MTNVKIYYGSKEEFDKRLPKSYKNLTELVYEMDNESRNFKLVIPNEQGDYPKNDSETEMKRQIKNLVVTSDEYAGVKEHVIINFTNFLSKIELKNLYIQNPPVIIEKQILKLFPKTEIEYQEYHQIKKHHLFNIREEFSRNIIGQEDVKSKLLQSIFPLTLEKRKKPLVLLFYGNSGIGKTETAKFLASVLEEKLFRKQFSMFQNEQFSTYLFGGTHNEKSFAKDLLDRESNVILLDEFDKAHPSFHSAFYQLFDEGIYEDQNYYLTLDRAVIICTSNYLNLNEIEEELGSAVYNRFDKIIYFKDLTDSSKIKIGQKNYKEINTKFENKLPKAAVERLKEEYVKCNNARQIYHLIEDVFSLSALTELKKNDTDLK